MTRKEREPLIVIDIPADLNMDDDDGRNFARLPQARPFSPGDIAVAGREAGWSWVMVDDADDAVVYFHQISSAEAASRGSLLEGA